MSHGSWRQTQDGLFQTQSAYHLHVCSWRMPANYYMYWINVKTTSKDHTLNNNSGIKMTVGHVKHFLPTRCWRLITNHFSSECHSQVPWAVSIYLQGTCTCGATCWRIRPFHIVPCHGFQGCLLLAIWNHLNQDLFTCIHNTQDLWLYICTSHPKDEAI